MQSVSTLRSAARGRWLVAIALAGAVAGLSVLSGALHLSSAQRERRLEAQQAAAAAGQIVERQMQALHDALVRLDERRHGVCDEICEADIAAHLRDMPELVELGWLGQSTDEDVLFLRASAAAGTVGPSPGAASIENHLASLRGAPATSRTQLQRVGHRRLTLSTASSVEPRRAIAVVDLDALVRRSVGEGERESLAIHLAGEQTLDPRSVTDDGVTAAATRTIYGVRWEFVVTEPPAATPFVAGLLLFGGFLTSVLIVIAVLWPSASAAQDTTPTALPLPSARPILQEPVIESPVGDH